MCVCVQPSLPYVGALANLADESGKDFWGLWTLIRRTLVLYSLALSVLLASSASIVYGLFRNLSFVVIAVSYVLGRRDFHPPPSSSLRMHHVPCGCTIT